MYFSLVFRYSSKYRRYFNGICIKMTASTCLICRQLINGAAVSGLRASCLAQRTSLAVRAPEAQKENRREAQDR
jgi:hypothetical protein